MRKENYYNYNQTSLVAAVKARGGTSGVSPNELYRVTVNGIESTVAGRDIPDHLRHTPDHARVNVRLLDPIVIEVNDDPDS